MQGRYEQQMKKGVLEMLVLKQLEKEEKYGYQLISQLKEKSDVMFTLKEGTLYPILYRLEDDGLVVSRWSEPKGKEVSRKYYEITEERPQEDLFKLWLQNTEKKATYFFNTSGNLYRTMNLKDKLNELSIEEKAKLLADNGMLIKRPLVIKDDGSVLCGFKEEKYKEFL